MLVSACEIMLVCRSKTAGCLDTQAELRWSSFILGLALFFLFGGGQTLCSDRAEEGPELLLCCCHLSQHRRAQLMVAGFFLEGR